MVWKSVADQPPCAVGEQANVLFCREDWSWPILGMVTNFGTREEWISRTGSDEHWSGQYDWSIYDQINDRYEEWNGREPTLWIERPDVPSAAA